MLFSFSATLDLETLAALATLDDLDVAFSALEYLALNLVAR